MAAQAQCDKHVCKMVIESAMMLSTAHRLYNKYDSIPSFLYKAGWINHPCTKWVCKSLQNYIWLSKHAQAISDEYTYRYGKIHKCNQVTQWCIHNVPDLLNLGLTNFPQCMPKELHNSDHIQAYRRYYQWKADKMIMKWTRRNPPEWWTK